MGFNGVDPVTGKVSAELLASAPTAQDSAKAMQLSIYSVADADLQAFAEQGKLKLAAPAKPKGK